MDVGVGDQLAGQQDGPVDQGAVGEGRLPVVAELLDKARAAAGALRVGASSSSSRR